MSRLVTKSCGHPSLTSARGTEHRFTERRPSGGRRASRSSVTLPLTRPNGGSPRTWTTRTLLGYARSIERGGLFELTEFFVMPMRQSGGLGRALIDRAFPVGRGDVRSIIATTDPRALARYYRAGAVARFPMLTLGGVPTETGITGDVTPRPLDADSEKDVSAMREIERSVLEFARDAAEIRWLLSDREGHLYMCAPEP